MLEVGIVYPILDNERANPIQYMPKKGMTIVTNEKNEVIPLRTIIGWTACMECRKVKKGNIKYHFPLHPFIDQMLDILARH